MNSIHNINQHPISANSQTLNLNHQQKQKEKRYKSFWYLIFINCNYALGNFYFGYCIIYLNSIQFTTIISIYSITLDSDLAQGLLVGCIPIGALVGALISNILLNNFSRRFYYYVRQSILIINVIAFIFGWLIYIQNFYVLLIVRLIQGVCVGSYSTFVPILIKQISPVEQSGKLGIIPQFFICFGIIFGFLFKFILSKATNDTLGKYIWIYVFGFTLIILFIQTLLLIFVFNNQTPKYLIEKEEYQKCKKLLSIIYKQKFVQQVFNEKIIDAKKIMGNNQNQQNSNSIIFVSNNDQLNKKQQLKLKRLKENQPLQQKSKSTPLKAAFISLHLGLLQQFCGINAVVVYSGQTINQVYPQLKQVFPIIINFIQFIAPLLLSPILAYAGRKIIIQFGTVFNIFTTSLIGAGFLIIDGHKQKAAGMIMAGLILFMVNFAFTLGPLIWLYIPEVAQPKVVTFATAVNWFGATFVMFLFPIIKGKVLNNNPGILFFFFAIWCFISFFVNQKFIVQTKDKTQTQIRQEFQNKSQELNNNDMQNKKQGSQLMNNQHQQSKLIVKN